MLILDEPTNHLDIESREALEDALRAFPGAILLVSHDRALLDAVGTRTIAVEDRARCTATSAAGPSTCGCAKSARAPVAAAVARRGAVTRGRSRSSNGAAGGTPAAAEALPEKRSPKKPKGPSKNRLSAQEKAERAVEEAEAALRRRWKQELADPAAWATRYEAAKSEARHTAARRAVEAAYARARGADRLTGPALDSGHGQDAERRATSRS